MAFDQVLSVLILRRLAAAAGHGFPGSAGGMEGKEPSTIERTLPLLPAAIDRAWLALEAALAGETLWERVVFAWGGDAGGKFTAQVRSFLNGMAQTELLGADPDFCRLARLELHAAREAGVLGGGASDAVARWLPEWDGAEGGLAQDHVARSEWGALQRLGGELEEAGYTHLSSLLALRSPGQEPLLLAAVLAFLEHAAENGLTGPPDVWNGAAPADGWNHAFRSLAAALDEHGPWLQALLNDLAAGAEIPARPRVKPGASEIQEGLCFYNQGAYNQAIAAFTAAIQQDPENAQAHAYRGEAHRLRCAYDLALADFDQAIRLAPSNAADFENRGLVHQLLGHHDAAVADFTEALRLAPQRAVTYNNRGASYAARAEYTLAVADFTEAVRLAPQYFWAYHNRGKAYNVTGEYGLAVADFTQVLALNPNHAPVYIDRGDAFRHQGEYDRAVADYTAALCLQPQSVPAHVNRGDAHRLKGDYEHALADYTEALRLDPGNALVLGHRGLIYRLRGQFDQALADLNEAVRLSPKNALAHYHRGKIHADRGDAEQAVAAFNDALWSYPQFAAAYVDRALVWEQLGRNEDAIADCDKALRLNGKLAPAYYVRGKAYFLAGNETQAVADLGRAIQLDPTFALAYHDRGMAQAGLKKPDAALADYTKAIRLDPRNALFYLNRSFAWKLKGDDRRAAADYHKAFEVDADLVRTALLWGVVPTARTRHAPLVAAFVEGRHPKPAETPEEAENAPPAAAAAVTPPPADPPAVNGKAHHKPEKPAAEPQAVATSPTEQAVRRPAAAAAPAAARESAPTAPAEPSDRPGPSPTNEDDVALAILMVPDVPPQPLAAPEPPASRNGDREPRPLSQPHKTGPVVPARPAAAPSAGPAAAAPRKEPAAAATSRKEKDLAVPKTMGRWDAPLETAAPPATASATAESKRRLRLKADGAGFLEKWKKWIYVSGGAAAVAMGAFLVPWHTKPTRVPVFPARGQVRFEGEPLPNAEIILSPSGKTEAVFPRPHATAREDGSFALGTYGKADGVPAGEYDVTVFLYVKTNPEDEGLPQNMLPAKYANPKTSHLSLRIEKKENQIPALNLTR